MAVRQGGSWQGALNTSQAQQGLSTLVTMVRQLSRADKTGDEAKQDQAFAQGHIAMIIANGWEVGVITDPKSGDPSLKDKLGVFPIPSHQAGQTAPVFLGGSDLGVAAHSKNQALADEWVGLLAGTKYQTQMATVGGVIPNTTSLLSVISERRIGVNSGLSSAFRTELWQGSLLIMPRSWASRRSLMLRRAEAVV